MDYLVTFLIRSEAFVFLGVDMSEIRTKELDSLRSVLEIKIRDGIKKKDVKKINCKSSAWMETS